jgi:hypothetical protein
VPDLDNVELNQLLAQARTSRLLATLGLAIREAGVFDRLSPNVSRHLQSGILIHEKQKADLAYDSEKIKLALDAIGAKLVLLKGAAYLLAELPVGRGRLITDIDIIVPKEHLDRVEATLKTSGWVSGDITAYDNQYYRKWGHEIPPLINAKRGTTLDVHHNILPPTAGPNVDARLLWDNLIEVRPGTFTLSWQDMVIHSATHLFHEGEFHHGLRDLWDLDRMLRDFPERDPQFWDSLISRARKLELLGSLYHGLNYTRMIFNTPIPQAVLNDATDRLRLLRKPLMDFLFLRAFRPNHPQCRLPFTGLALFLLYVRSHYLRMPLYLLLPHLAKKAWSRQFDAKKASVGNGNTEKA